MKQISMKVDASDSQVNSTTKELGSIAGWFRELINDDSDATTDALILFISAILWNSITFLLSSKLSPHFQFAVTLVSVGLGALVIFLGISNRARRQFLLVAILIFPILPWLLRTDLGSLAIGATVAGIGLLYERIGAALAQSVRRQVRYAQVAKKAVQSVKATKNERPRLIAHACHDLHQPVHTLEMMLDCIDVYAPPDEIAARLREVDVAIQTLSDMITDILDLARLEEGHYAIELQPVSIWHVLRETDQLYGWLARRKGLEWVISPSRVWVQCDPGMLRRVINNLVSNAIKYTMKGSVGISCTSEKGTVKLKISDTGIGIPADQIDLAFKDYVRLEGANHEAGHGIGLSVVRRMLDLLGRRLKVESIVGVGSRFTIELPQVQRHNDIVDEPSLAFSGVRSWENALIVYVENDDQMRVSTAEMLTSWGANVIAAGNVKSALEDPILQSRTPSLVISDMHLGLNIDGLGVIAEFRKRYPQPLLPAILLTGDVQPGLQEVARGLDVRMGYKPLRPAKLRELISSALAGQMITEPMPLGVYK